MRASAAALPPPDEDQARHSDAVAQRIGEEIARAGGRIPFRRYMELALYEPALGYYVAGSRKLGAGGDFVTAPELTPLYGQALAVQVAELVATGLRQVIEIGPGSGALAAAMLEELERRDALPDRYLLLDLSPELAERARATLARRVPHLLDRVQQASGLPAGFEGVVIGNEVLDAMPFDVVVARGGEILEGLVQPAGADGGFSWLEWPASAEIERAARALDLPDGYRTELQLAAQAFVRTLAGQLDRGVVLLVDYGFPAREFYHPQRDHGTLMCHYRHRAHDDPFFLPGLQDITCHVDFSAIARVALDAGLDILGYTSQARFLVNCDITGLLARAPADDATRFLPLANAVQRLVSPAEMGELFKVIALGKGCRVPLCGFRQGDRRHSL